MARKFRFAILAVLFSTLIGLAWAQQNRSGVPPVPTEPLTAEEAAYLNYMLEEEKMARDVYLVLYEEWDNAVFANIAVAEQNHLERVAAMLDRYGVEPVIGEPGLFVEPQLAALFADLVAQGSASAVDALFAGALIEETDINDLLSALESTGKPDLQRLFSNLMRGSRNHLRAFVSQIELQGLEYQAHVLTQEEIDSIVDSPRERGRSRNCASPRCERQSGGSGPGGDFQGRGQRDCLGGCENTGGPNNGSGGRDGEWNRGRNGSRDGSCQG